LDKLTKSTFEALFAIEDLREILRETAPFHKLTNEQKRQVRDILSRIKKALDEIEGELK
jgi:Sep-tRNA:Cys-tRNA synthetase